MDRLPRSLRLARVHDAVGARVRARLAGTTRLSHQLGLWCYDTQQGGKKTIIAEPIAYPRLCPRRIAIEPAPAGLRCGSATLRRRRARGGNRCLEGGLNKTRDSGLGLVGFLLAWVGSVSGWFRLIWFGLVKLPR